MKKYIYPSLVIILTAISIHLFIYTIYQASDITHYKKLYYETDKALESHLVKAQLDSTGKAAVMAQESDKVVD